MHLTCLSPTETRRQIDVKGAGDDRATDARVAQLKN
jgi:hypothetical protein